MLSTLAEKVRPEHCAVLLVRCECLRVRPLPYSPSQLTNYKVKA